MAKKSAQAIVDDLTAVGEDIRQRAVEETREYVARAVEEMFLGGPNVGRRQFGGGGASGGNPALRSPIR